MFSVELTKVEDDWLWHNGRIGSMIEVVFGCFGKLAVEKVKDRMYSIASGEEPSAWRD
jgi:hypothetical protein